MTEGTTDRYVWGDVDDLVEVMRVRPLGGGRFTSNVHADERRPVVEGSQMLGQAIYAAATSHPGRRAVSANMVFVRAADAREPLWFELDEVESGRTFTTLRVTVGQDERVRAVGTLLLDTTAPDVIGHCVEAPAVAGPEESEPYDMAVEGRELRVVGGAYSDDPDAPVGPPSLDAWVRFEDLPDDEPLHAALLAQFTGHMSIAAAMRPHPGVGQRDAHGSISTAINAISLSLHCAPRADDWMLYHHLSTFAGDGMTHSECRVHGESGALLASFTVEAMVRPFRAQGAPPDRETAL